MDFTSYSTHIRSGRELKFSQSRARFQSNQGYMPGILRVYRTLYPLKVVKSSSAVISFIAESARDVQIPQSAEGRNEHLGAD